MRSSATARRQVLQGEPEDLGAAARALRHGMNGGDGVLSGLNNVVPELFMGAKKAFRDGDLAGVAAAPKEIGRLSAALDAHPNRRAADAVRLCQAPRQTAPLTP